MINGRKKNGMTRREALELYKDLQKNMSTMMAKNAKSRANNRTIPEESIKKDTAVTETTSSGGYSRTGIKGTNAAFIVILAFSLSRVVLSSLEYSGALDVKVAEASYATKASFYPPGHFSREEVKILTSLDARRAELEERSKKIDEKEEDLNKRDTEFAVRLTELRELTGRLRSEREKDQQKRNAQLDQLANVYGSMNPKESAQLIEQLDIATALSLVERMSEKRIGQILPMMTPERALAITRMLSGKKE